MQCSSEHFSEGNLCWENERENKQIIRILNNLCTNIFMSKREFIYDYIWYSELTLEDEHYKKQIIWILNNLRDIFMSITWYQLQHICHW
jgi:hypothetical protein